MDDFSKFMHACAGLLPDMVRLRRLDATGPSHHSISPTAVTAWRCRLLCGPQVRAVPQWVDDPGVQKSLYANVMANEDLQALLLAGHNVVAELEEGQLEAAEQPLAASRFAAPLLVREVEGHRGRERRMALHCAGPACR
jgi:hypothetical protein